MIKEKYLPLGTVVRLKDATKCIMIVGFCTAVAEDPENIRDYAGCLFPEGVLSSDMNLVFDHNQIEEIIYIGLDNDEHNLFNSRLKEFMENGTIDGQVPDFSGVTESSEQVNTNIEVPMETLEVSPQSTDADNNDVFNI